MILSNSKTTLREILNGHTFNANPLSISTIGTLAPMQLMVNCKGLVWVAPLKGSSSLKKVRKGWDGALTPMRDRTSWGVVSIGTSFPCKASRSALMCLWKPLVNPKLTHEIESFSVRSRPYLPLLLIPSHWVQRALILPTHFFRGDPSPKSLVCNASHS